MKLFKVLLSIWERHGTEQVKEKGYRADGVVEGEAAASAVEAAMDRDGMLASAALTGAEQKENKVVTTNWYLAPFRKAVRLADVKVPGIPHKQAPTSPPKV
jgi:hypothetical protein